MNKIPGLLLALVIAVVGGWSAEFIGTTLMGLPKSPVSGIMMAILIAGRIGSAMAAEIGSMRVYQEIDALRTMNINPIHYLVLPRLIAIASALP